MLVAILHCSERIDMIYTINSGNTTAKVSTYGAELVSFVKDSREYIWQGDEKYWKGQNPILFPVLCSLKDGKATIDGCEINLPKHGFARKSEFSLVSLSDNSVTLALSDSDSTRESYPFEFIFTVTHTVSEGAFRTTFNVINKSNKKMMFHVGGHTGFNIPICGEGGFSDHRLVFDKVENAINYKAPTGALIVNPEGDRDVLTESDTMKLDYSMFDHDAIMLADLKSQHVSLVDKHGHGVRMKIDNFGALGIWTPAYKNAPFICLEPWNGLPAFENESGRFEDKPFAIALDPGKSYETYYTVELI